MRNDGAFSDVIICAGFPVYFYGEMQMSRPNAYYG